MSSPVLKVWKASLLSRVGVTFVMLTRALSGIFFSLESSNHHIPHRAVAGGALFEKNMSSQCQHDLHPLCDKHYCPMVQTSTGDSKRPEYACSVDQCPRHYEVVTGYFDVLNGRTLADKYGKQACKNDASAMYVEAYDLEKQEETWGCPAVACIERLKRMTCFPAFLSFF